MSKVCHYHDSHGERHFDASFFPITIGGRDVDIILPGVTSADGFAYVDFSSGRPFVQAEQDSEIYLNDEKLQQSAWLNDGDRIKIGAALVSCKLDSCIPEHQQIILRLQAAVGNKKRVLRPPPASGPVKLTAPVATPDPQPKVAIHKLQVDDKRMTLKTILLGGFFILLLVLVSFVFSAAPVVLDINPQPDNIELDGFLPSLEFGNHYLVWPGSYRVKADKVGYMTLNQLITVNSDRSESYRFTLQKLGGILQLHSEPLPGAEVFIDSQLVGKTPLTEVQVTPGMHRIVFKLDRFQDAEQLLEVTGEGKRQLVTGRLEPNWATINFVSVPAQAQVNIEGVEAGETPLQLDLPAGTHLLDFVKSGYQVKQANIAVIAGQDQQYPTIKLEKLPGRLMLHSKPGNVNVLLGNKYQGQTPLKLKLKPDQPHELKLIKAGYAEVRKSVTVDSGAEQTLHLALVPQYGEVKLQGIPLGATLLINGKVRENVGGSLQLTTREHQLEVRKDGYNTYKTSITPRYGFAQQIDVKLTAIGSLATIGKSSAKAENSTMVYIKPGTFMMGASRREQGRRGNEVLHEVKLTRPFYIAKREVSNAEFRRFMPEHYSGSAPGHSLDEDRQPVVNVSWDDVARYCNWLSEQQSFTPVYIEKEGIMLSRMPISNGYRLPTEAEWAWVARYAQSGKASMFPWGPTFPIAANSGNYATGDDYPATSPTASFKANRLGIYDLGGNVSEWVHNYYSVFPAFGAKAIVDPSGPENGKHHVIRGSSWRQGSFSELRLSYRDYANKKRPDLGFRVARYAN